MLISISSLHKQYAVSDRIIITVKKTGKLESRGKNDVKEFEFRNLLWVLEWRDKVSHTLKKGSSGFLVNQGSEIAPQRR
jgi:hypothetical protein